MVLYSNFINKISMRYRIEGIDLFKKILILILASLYFLGCSNATPKIESFKTLKSSIDNSPPLAPFAIISDFTTNTSQININGTCEAGAYIYLESGTYVNIPNLDSKASTLCKADSTFNLNVSESSDASYSYLLYQIDASGNISESIRITWIKDTSISVPTVTNLVTPYTSATTSVTISGTCEAEANVYLNRNGVNVGNTICTLNNTYSITINNSIDGYFTYNIFQKDRAGNNSDSISWVWNRTSDTPISDTTPPLAVVLKDQDDLPLGSTIYTKSSSSLNLSIYCELNATIYATVSGGGITSLVSIGTCSSGTVSYSFSKSRINKAIDVFQKDAASNQSPNTTLNWIIDDIPPAFEVNAISVDGLYASYNSESPLLIIKPATDTGGSGIKKYKIRIQKYEAAINNFINDIHFSEGEIFDPLTYKRYIPTGGVTFEEGKVYRIVVTAFDNATNSTEVSSSPWTVDTRIANCNDGSHPNYVSIPAYYTPSFCVAKFEMKALSYSNTLIADGDITYSSTNSATSRNDGTPWVNISRNEAIDECKSIGTASENDLINNEQWQSIARSIEQIPANWTGGTVGNGSIFRGHSDNFPASSLSVADLANGYDQTGHSDVTPQTTQRRTLKLLSGVDIWDFAGNVSEWIKDDHYDSSNILGISNYWRNITDISSPNKVTVGSVNGNAKFLFGPFGDYTLLSSDGGSVGLGYGEIFFGTGSPNDTAIIRGGYYNHPTNQNYTGIYYTKVHAKTDQGDSTIGFRCVYTPPRPF